VFTKITCIPKLWDVKYYKNILFIKAFGKNLRKIRLEKNISQEQLANDIDIPINQIGRIERGEINTSISVAYALTKALKVDIVELFDFKLMD
jgi:transcriptional regulator with XRE-family HTH domain